MLVHKCMYFFQIRMKDATVCMNETYNCGLTHITIEVNEYNQYLDYHYIKAINDW